MKQWMRQRPDESTAAWQARLNRTCYACGTEFPTTAECDVHEETCPKAHPNIQRRKT